jgi:hypothetical protein
VTGNAQNRPGGIFRRENQKPVVHTTMGDVAGFTNNPVRLGIPEAATGEQDLRRLLWHMYIN